MSVLERFKYAFSATADQVARANKPITKKEATVTVGRKGNTGYFDVAETDEHLPALDGRLGSVIFDKMRRSDGKIEAILNAVKLPILQADYFVEPGSDDERDKQIAKMLEFNLFEDMSSTWQDIMTHILLMFDFGFMIQEKVYKMDNRKGSPTEGLFVFKDFAPRLPLSIDFWKYDKATRKLIIVKQIDSDGERIDLPIQKLLIYTNKKEGDNWEGRSMLRPIYRNWFVKDKLIKIDAIAHERLGAGVIALSAPKGVDDGSPQWSAAQTTVNKIHANENGGLVLGDGWKFEIVQGKGKGTDVVPSIKMHNQEMGVSILSQFLDLGTSETGNRALGSAFIDLFLKSIQSHVDSILSVINKFAIQEWVRFNFGEVGFFPKIKANKIKSLDTTEIAALSTAGLITPDFETENAIRRNEKLPEILEEDREAKIKAKKEKELKPENTEVPDDEKDDIAEDDNKDKSLHNTPKKSWQFVTSARELKPLIIDPETLAPEEKLVSLQAIDNALTEHQIPVEDTLLEMREKQIDDLIKKLIGGRKVQDLRVILKADMSKFLKAEYRDMRQIGREQVRDEKEQQQIGISFQELPPPEALGDITGARIDLEVEGSADKLKTIMTEIKITGIDQGLSGDDLEAFMVTESADINKSTWIGMAATAVNKGWGDGRRIQSLVFEKDIQYGFYSSILDSARCPNCESTQNQQTAIGGRHQLEDPRFVTPNPNCLGRTKCRCFTIYVFEDIA